MVSIMLTYPPRTSFNSFSMLMNMLLSNSSLADGLISSSTVRHMPINVFSLAEYLAGISLYCPLVILR